MKAARSAPAMYSPNQQILIDRHFIKGARDLVGSANTQVTPPCRGLISDVPFHKGDAPAVCLENPGEQVEHGCLAGTVGAHNSQDLPLSDLEGEPADGFQVAEVLLQIVYN